MIGTRQVYANSYIYRARAFSHAHLNHIRCISYRLFRFSLLLSGFVCSLLFLVVICVSVYFFGTFLLLFLVFLYLSQCFSMRQEQSKSKRTQQIERIREKNNLQISSVCNVFIGLPQSADGRLFVLAHVVILNNCNNYDLKLFCIWLLILVFAKLLLSTQSFSVFLKKSNSHLLMIIDCILSQNSRIFF